MFRRGIDLKRIVVIPDEMDVRELAFYSTVVAWC